MEDNQVATLLRLAEIGRDIAKGLASIRGSAGDDAAERRIAATIDANLAMALRIAKRRDQSLH